ncbi:hypothetical protein N9O56_02415 [Rickettsiales bacterium]|nr:hypothetical protein [Rickettsiales bacterium]
MRKIFILSTILTFLLFGFAMYKYTHHPDSRRAICGYNFKYPENSEKYLKFFVKMDLEKFVNLDDKIINLNNKTVVTREIVKKGQKRCLLAFSLSLPVIFWVFTCSLMTLTPWGWRLDFWKIKFESMVERNIVVPLIIIMPPVILIYIFIFLYKLLLNIY